MSKNIEKNIKTAFILNLLFSIIELIGGLITNSISIISDSVHDFGDSMAIAISWILEKKSKKQPDKKYTYGYRRYSVLGGLITSVILLIGAVVVIYGAIPRIINPQTINYNGMLVLSVIGLIVNGLAAYTTHNGEGVNEKAVNLHMLEDVFGWFAVLITSVVMKFFDIPILDPILSIIITGYILIHVFKNIKAVFEILLNKAPNNIDMDKIKEELLKNEDIKDIHHIHIWTSDGINSYVTMHVVINEITEEKLIEIKEFIRHKLKHENILHITIEIESINEDCHNEVCKVDEIEHNHTHIGHHH